MCGHLLEITLLSHPALAEEEAIHRAICMAKLVDAPLLIVHVSTPEGAALVQNARQAGAMIYGETCPQYLFLTREDMDKPDMQGAAFMCSPPLRDKPHRTRFGRIFKRARSMWSARIIRPIAWMKVESSPMVRTRRLR